jgi:predicted DNA binding CopG/RHH family protein
MMRRTKLDKEEKEIMKAIEQNEFLPVRGKELRAVADAVAARKRDMTLTIRVNRKDINLIKKMAQAKGIPYQSYLSEVIHRVAVAV